MTTRLPLIAFTALLAAGCVQTRVTEPKRAAVEQLLLSTAADRALEQADFVLFNGRKVYVDERYFESYDEEYVIGTIRNRISESGGLLVAELADAEVIVEPRSGALSTDAAESIIGLPSMPVPVPFAGTVTSPEVALYKSQKQFATAKIALFAYYKDSRVHLHSTGDLYGEAKHNYYTFLGFFKYTSSTLPSKQNGFFPSRGD